MPEILSVILKIVFIVFFFGFCVFIHEFGHLLVALWQGLHVETFSVGMGPKLWGFKYKGVEYVISWLPFGGYVSLPQLDPTDTPATSDGKSLPHAKPFARAMTAFAGPLFNILFGFILAAIMWGAGLWRPTPSTSVLVTGVPGYIPTSGGVAPSARVLAIDDKELPPEDQMRWIDACYVFGETRKGKLPEELTLTVLDDGPDSTPKTVLVRPEVNEEWRAGLRSGDRIVKVNGKSFNGGNDEFRKEYVYGNTGHVTLEAVRDGERLTFTYSPQKNPAMEGLGFPFFESANPSQVADIKADSPAARAGIHAGDQLLSFNGRNVLGPVDFIRDVQRARGTSSEIVVARNGVELPPMTLEVPDVEKLSEKELGISFYVLAVGVVKDSPAAKAGIQYGDRFVKLQRVDKETGEVVAENPVQDVQGFQGFVRNSGGDMLLVTCDRGGKEFQTSLVPYEDPSNPGVYLMGVVLSTGLTRSLQHIDPWTQFSEIIGTTTRTLGLLFAPLTSRAKSVVTGTPREVSQTQVGVRHMSGPLGIIQALWYKLKSEGYRGGFSFIILITFSLAFMNLLPLPVLDGGHIVFAAIESITRRRIPAVFFKYIYNTFAILLIALMLYITLFDGRRILRYSGFSDPNGKTTAPEVEENAGEEPPADTETPPESQE